MKSITEYLGVFIFSILVRKLLYGFKLFWGVDLFIVSLTHVVCIEDHHIPFSQTNVDHYDLIAILLHGLEAYTSPTSPLYYLSLGYSISKITALLSFL